MCVSNESRLYAHGLSGFIKESMMVRGDEYEVAICNKTGCIAVYNESSNIFLSPMADGPVKFVGNLVDDLNVVNVSKYGRDFSIIKVPYAFKLMMQELQAMNVQMRIIMTKCESIIILKVKILPNYHLINFKFRT